MPCTDDCTKHRQEVCESVEWFRSYQGGVYFNRLGAHGYLLSAFSARRDLFHHEGKLIISHGGGRAEALHSREGKLMAYQASDQQANDKSIRALLSSYEQRRPIVLLIDDKYELFPYDLNSSNADYTYVALGNYLITRVWAERSTPKSSSESVIRYKFAFQWCHEQGEPWWHQSQPDHASFGFEQTDIGSTQRSAGITVRSCRFCRRASPLIYKQGWMCATPDCPEFWHLEDGTVLPEALNYSDSFLVLLKLPPAGCMDIRPLPPADSGTNGVTTSQEFTRGFHCRKCGRLSCRAKWEFWECFSCGDTYRVEGRLRLPNDLWKKMNLGFDRHKVHLDAGIVKSQFSQYRDNNMYGHSLTFILPNGRGRIHHVLGGPLLNKRANDIFRRYQEQAADGQISFRRWPIRTHKCRGDLLAQYFSHNGEWPVFRCSISRKYFMTSFCGSPQYVGGTDETVSFDEAPSAVMEALSLVQDRTSQVLGRGLTFNEILSAAYMQDQQMAGDVLVMEGLGVQQYYEHQVQPVDFRIAATARMIDPEGTTCMTKLTH
ncbi:hypothetical protein NEOLEDRAFT_1057099 [Neolentinus lepideus HHB14362 ss-1]|uniref:Uncharacterized protein n=1 Tax=Neolentinus lepideus HHB14362 ss-1 TaxID=1314782 RepID=A0A165V1G0_9AGAM|nr:hypothetical protein NEOLEDRAFT_1057099 [Neolentinus lepideus HHB14362 ss-1]